MTMEKRLERIEALLEKLVADKCFDSKTPLTMREAALACNVPLRTLRSWVDLKLIPAYRNGPESIWRVFPKDVKAFLMAESNLTPARRKRVLRRTLCQP
jgi:hypothetical protein